MNKVYEELPPIRRARDFRLYDHKGQRFVDFWQEDGSLFLGHRPESVLKQIKNELSKGLLGPLPSIWQRKLRQMLRLYFPGYHLAGLFADRETLVKDWGMPTDPFVEATIPGTLTLWRPWTQNEKTRGPMALLAPGVGRLGWWIVLEEGADTSNPQSSFAQDSFRDLVTAQGLALLAHSQPQWEPPLVLAQHPLLHWIGRSWFLRLPEGANDSAVHRAFVRNGFYLPPSLKSPGFWPLQPAAQLSQGELSAFVKLLEEQPWKI